jgi:hypothetical protein
LHFYLIILINFFIVALNPLKIDSPTIKCPILNSLISLTFVNILAVL